MAPLYEPPDTSTPEDSLPSDQERAYNDGYRKGLEDMLSDAESALKGCQGDLIAFSTLLAIAWTSRVQNLDPEI